jgi:hypothetical protein
VEADIEQLLSQSRVIQLESETRTDGSAGGAAAAGLLFSKTTFVADTADGEVDVNDPAFWQKVLGKDSRETLLNRLTDGTATASPEAVRAFLVEIEGRVREIVSAKLDGTAHPPFLSHVSEALVQLSQMKNSFTEGQRNNATAWLQEIERPTRRRRKAAVEVSRYIDHDGEDADGMRNADGDYINDGSADEDHDEYVENGGGAPKRVPLSLAQIDIVSGDVICIYPSTAAAAQAVSKDGGRPDYIASCARGKHPSAYGYKWWRVTPAEVEKLVVVGPQPYHYVAKPAPAPATTTAAKQIGAKSIPNPALQVPTGRPRHYSKHPPPFSCPLCAATLSSGICTHCTCDGTCGNGHAPSRCGQSRYKKETHCNGCRSGEGHDKRREQRVHGLPSAAPPRPAPAQGWPQTGRGVGYVEHAKPWQMHAAGSVNYGPMHAPQWRVNINDGGSMPQAGGVKYGPMHAPQRRGHVNYGGPMPPPRPILHHHHHHYHHRGPPPHAAVHASYGQMRAERGPLHAAAGISTWSAPPRPPRHMTGGQTQTSAGSNRFLHAAANARTGEIQMQASGEGGRGGSRCCKGKIMRKRHDGTFDIVFDDGEKEMGVDKSLLKSLDGGGGGGRDGMNTEHELDEGSRVGAIKMVSGEMIAPTNTPNTGTLHAAGCASSGREEWDSTSEEEALLKALHGEKTTDACEGQPRTGGGLIHAGDHVNHRQTHDASEGEIPVMVVKTRTLEDRLDEGARDAIDLTSDEVTAAEEQQVTPGIKKFCTKELNFPAKLHYIVENEPYIEWTSDGTIFRISSMTNFVEKVMPRHFPPLSPLPLSQYRAVACKAFLRQLKNYSFKTPEKHHYQHPIFRRDTPIQNIQNMIQNVEQTTTKKQTPVGRSSPTFSPGVGQEDALSLPSGGTGDTDGGGRGAGTHSWPSEWTGDTHAGRTINKNPTAFRRSAPTSPPIVRQEGALSLPSKGTGDAHGGGRGGNDLPFVPLKQLQSNGKLVPPVVGHEGALSSPSEGASDGHGNGCGGSDGSSSSDRAHLLTAPSAANAARQHSPVNEKKSFAETTNTAWDSKEQIERHAERKNIGKNGLPILAKELDLLPSTWKGIPTAVPTNIPTLTPTVVPTTQPTLAPTAVPTATPTALLTALPSQFVDKQLQAIKEKRPANTFSDSENKALVLAHAEHGNQWAKILKSYPDTLGSRTARSLANRWARIKAERTITDPAQMQKNHISVAQLDILSGEVAAAGTTNPTNPSVTMLPAYTSAAETQNLNNRLGIQAAVKMKMNTDMNMNNMVTSMGQQQHVSQLSGGVPSDMLLVPRLPAEEVGGSPTGNLGKGKITFEATSIFSSYCCCSEGIVQGFPSFMSPQEASPLQRCQSVRVTFDHPGFFFPRRTLLLAQIVCKPESADKGIVGMSTPIDVDKVDRGTTVVGLLVHPDDRTVELSHAVYLFIPPVSTGWKLAPNLFTDRLGLTTGYWLLLNNTDS